jgi:thiol-disulfide isomerase/thioredoxin
MKKKNKEIQSWFWNLSYIDMATSFVYSGICWTGWWLKLVCYYVCLQDFSASWEIKATPTFFFLRDGQQVDKLVGANKPELHKKITAILDSLPPSAKWLLWWFLVSVRAPIEHYPVDVFEYWSPSIVWFCLCILFCHVDMTNLMQAFCCWYFGRMRNSTNEYC